METPLSPLGFMGRARSLFTDKEAVVDGAVRLTYDQLFQRCDRWSVVLQRLGVAQGDRVACIAPNTHAHLEAYYACLLYTSDAADERSSVDLGGRRIIKKK